MTTRRVIPLLLVPFVLGSCGDPPHEDAQRLIELGDLSRAERVLSEAVERSPDDVLTRELLVRVHERRGSEDLALESARVLVSVRGYPADHFLLARIAAQTGDFQSASRVLDPWSDEEMEALVRGAFEAAGRGLPDDHWIPPVPDPEEYRILGDLGVGDYLAASAFVRFAGETNWTWARFSREVMDPLWSALWLSPDLRDRFADSFLEYLEQVGDLPALPAGGVARDLARLRDLSDLEGHHEMRGRLLAYLGEGDRALQEFQSLETAATADEFLEPDAVVTAGDFRLGVEDAAELLASVEDLSNQAQVEALAGFWADFVLLAWVMNREGGLEDLDLSPVVRQQTEQELVTRLRDRVIEAESTVTDEEVRAVYDKERPGEEVRARHILLLYPDQATEAQRDSVRRLAEQLRDRARAGEDFEGMARQYSEDPGAAPRGGDLGYFQRGVMVAPFEEAAFALEPGEVSDVVETRFGLHVIRSEDRRRPWFEDVEESLREELTAVRTVQAESIFVADLEERAGIRMEDDAPERMREITHLADYPLSGRAARRALARYEGGSFTAEEYRQFLLTQDRSIRQQMLNAADEGLEDILRNLIRDKLLVEEARREGLEIPSGEIEELRRELRREYRSAAETLRLSGITPREEESLGDAVDREVRELMFRLISGEQELISLRTLAVPLRMQYGVRLSEPGIQRTVERVAELRNGEDS